MSDRDPSTGSAPGPLAPADLPSVVHDSPAAVLLVDTVTGRVVHVDDLARRLAPRADLPLAVADWARAAGLRLQEGGTGTGGSGATSWAHLVAGERGTGRQRTAVLLADAPDQRRGPDGPRAPRAWWAIAMPVLGAPAPLRDRSLLVLMPLDLPGGRAAPSSVLAGGLAMAISDPTREDDPLVWVSRSFEQVTGYTSTEVLGRNCRFLQGTDTDPATVTRLREAIAADRAVDVTLLNYRHDGSAFHNHLLVSPVFDAGGRLIHHVSVQSDVTQQVLTARQRDAARAAGERARAETRRAQAARTAAERTGRFNQLLLTLSQALAAATSVEDVAGTVTEVVAREMGAAGGGLMLADPTRTRLDFVSTAAMPPGTDGAWSRIDWHEDAPLALAVRSRRALFYRDSAAMRAVHPGITAHAELPAMGATVTLPLVSAGATATAETRGRVT
ncbi:PAS domain-containing protein, partial [Kineococcus sp. T13]|uniref:PAS domain-containing protein n=1 Tax=Kineococcus vitellinus TaxID=2696565 RepID=UPI0014120336|nr:PAS domain-containing protein [Kineococcus vitellinus]